MANQINYTKALLKKYGMQDCKPVSTPVDANRKVMAENDKDEPTDQQQYQSMIGSLMYLAVNTRPDICYAIGKLAKFSNKPTKTHLTALKRVLRYLKGTADHGILHQKQKSGCTCVGFFRC